MVAVAFGGQPDRAGTRNVERQRIAEYRNRGKVTEISNLEIPPSVPAPGATREHVGDPESIRQIGIKLAFDPVWRGTTA